VMASIPDMTLTTPVDVRPVDEPRVSYQGREVAQLAVLVAVLQSQCLQCIRDNHALDLVVRGGYALEGLEALQGLCTPLCLVGDHPENQTKAMSPIVTPNLIERLMPDHGHLRRLTPALPCKYSVFNKHIGLGNSQSTIICITVKGPAEVASDIMNDNGL
jgi:hypothetical protein